MFKRIVLITLLGIISVSCTKETIREIVGPTDTLYVVDTIEIFGPERQYLIDTAYDAFLNVLAPQLWDSWDFPLLSVPDANDGYITATYIVQHSNNIAETTAFVVFDITATWSGNEKLVRGLYGYHEFRVPGSDSYTHYFAVCEDSLSAGTHTFEYGHIKYLNSSLFANVMVGDYRQYLTPFPDSLYPNQNTWICKSSVVNPSL